MHNSPNPSQKTLVYLSAFGISMGFLEAAVVVYLRQIYYPEGFGFPLRAVVPGGLSLEYLREVATLVMLLSVSVAAGKTLYERFAYFLYTFGVWDIFYYFWLKVLLDWPPLLSTWDVLFLIPVVWAGPVLAPLIVAVTMVLFSGTILYFVGKGYPVKISRPGWISLSSGALAIFISFIWDYSSVLVRGGFLTRLPTLGKDPQFQRAMTTHVPGNYHWTLFTLGEGMILLALAFFLQGMKSVNKRQGGGCVCSPK